MNPQIPGEAPTGDVADGAAADEALPGEDRAELLPVQGEGDNGEYVAARLLVKFRKGSEQAAEGLVEQSNARVAGEIPRIGVKIIELPEQASETAHLNAFRQRAEVEFAELDRVVVPAAIPNDPYYPQEWHLAKIAAPSAWDVTTGSSSVIIAILDTGCDPTHPDLAPKYVPGWNFYDNNADTSDVNGHGTAVAGQAAASSNNGIGVASPTWGCAIMPIRISDTTCTTTISRAANGVVWAADHGARVANISFLVTGYSTLDSAAEYLLSKGGVVTVAAGNSGQFVSTAEDPYVLTVSATDQNDVLASWSNTGNCIDLAVPGVNISTTVMGGGYGAGSGTSASAAVLAGVAALVISANANLSGEDVQNVLTQSADDLGAPGWDPSYGWGRVNAARAVSLALVTPAGGGDTTPPTVSFSAPAAGATVSGTVSVQVSAADNVGVTSAQLYVDTLLLGSATASPYVYSWNTTSVANGAHTLEAQAFDAAGNSASASISVNVSNPVADTQAPSVTITSPVSGAKVRSSLAVAASASDNVGVRKVELYVDGKLAATDTTTPYSFSVNTKKWSLGAHSLQCKAYDAAGNVGVSAVVTVNK